MRVSGHGNWSSRSWLERLAEGRLAARGSMLRSCSGRICGRDRALSIAPIRLALPITLQPFLQICELLMQITSKVLLAVGRSLPSSLEDLLPSSSLAVGRLQVLFADGEDEGLATVAVGHIQLMLVPDGFLNPEPGFEGNSALHGSQAVLSRKTIAANASRHLEQNLRINRRELEDKVEMRMRMNGTEREGQKEHNLPERNLGVNGKQLEDKWSSIGGSIDTLMCFGPTHKKKVKCKV